MKTPVARYGLGSLLLLAVAGIFWLDRDAARITPVVALLLGLGAALEYWRAAAPAMPAKLRAAGVPVLLAASAVAAFFVVRGEHADLNLCLGALVPVALFVAATALLCERRGNAVQAADFGQTLHLPACVAMTILPMAALAALSIVPHCGTALAFTVVLGSKLNDIGGYIGGSLFGRHKLCPGVSPNKTVEGALTGMALGIGGTMLLAAQLPELATVLPPHRALILGVALAIATQVGDLFESAFKRSMNVKDSGALLPAFGGMLDLIDSFIFAAPLGYTLAGAWIN